MYQSSINVYQMSYFHKFVKFSKAMFTVLPKALAPTNRWFAEKNRLGGDTGLILTQTLTQTLTLILTLIPTLVLTLTQTLTQTEEKHYFASRGFFFFGE